MVWSVLLATFPLLMPGPFGDKPYLGVMVEAVPHAVEIDGKSFKHGLVVRWVQSKSGAGLAGLLVGDLIVDIKGMDFNCPTEKLREAFGEHIAGAKIGDPLVMVVLRDTIDRRAVLGDKNITDQEAWEHPDSFVESEPAGTSLELTVTRVRQLLTLNATLGPRLETSGAGMRPIPPNDQIFPTPIDLLPEAKVADVALSRFKVAKEYDVLRERLSSLVERGDPFRLSRFAYAMREPFAMPNLSRMMADVPRDTAGVLAHAATWIDHDVGRLPFAPLRTGLTPQEHAAQIERVLLVAAELFDDAFAGVTQEEKQILEETLSDVAESFKEVIMVLTDPDDNRLAGVHRFVEIAPKVDTGKLVSAAICLTALFDDNYLQGLRDDFAGMGTDIIYSADTRFGRIVITGDGDTWVRQPAAVLIDLGGNDFYTQRTQKPFSIVIDMAGDDLHQATFDFAQAAGFMGVSMLCDLQGDDTYIAQQWSQGSCAVGVGVLLDISGDDTYRAADFSQAAALCGVGLLIDEAGEDRYEAPRYAQALAMPGGFAALIDRLGDDRYYCSGRDITNYGMQGVFDAFGQGCGIGFRRLASGGVALLLDEMGDDTYFGGNFAQGGGYYFGWGCLVDRVGNDRYIGSRYAQAWAAHQAIGFLEDHDGDDHYLARRTVGQSCSWDETVTALIDHKGNDYYSGGDFCLCASHNNGWALLVDYDGSDRYNSLIGVPRADGDEAVTSFSLMLDMGQGDDTDGAGQAIDKGLRHGNRNAFFGKLPGHINDALPNINETIIE